MRISIVRLGEVFIKQRESSLPQKGVALRESMKITFANAVLITGLAVSFFFFGMPTPDIRHDIRCVVNPDFSRYSESKRKIYLGQLDENMIRSFQFHDNRLDKITTYGPYNESKFKIQDYSRKI